MERILYFKLEGLEAFKLTLHWKLFSANLKQLHL